MFTAVYVALKDLERIRPAKAEDISRQAIILLSDGEDTSSLVPFEDVLDLAKRSHTSIYAIGIRSPELAAGPRLTDGEFVLRRLAQETGGAAFFPCRPMTCRASTAKWPTSWPRSIWSPTRPPMQNPTAAGGG